MIPILPDRRLRPDAVTGGYSVNLYWEKMIGFPLFVLLGGLALDVSMGYVPVMFFLLMVLYPVVVILMARDPLMDCPHFLYRALVIGSALAVYCWIQRWPYLIVFVAALYLTGPTNTNPCARRRRFLSHARRLPRNGNT